MTTLTTVYKLLSYCIVLYCIVLYCYIAKLNYIVCCVLLVTVCVTELVCLVDAPCLKKINPLCCRASSRYLVKHNLILILFGSHIYEGR